MDSATTLIVTAKPNADQMESVQEYLGGVLPLLISVGGRPVKRLKVHQVIRGAPSGMVLVMDFDSSEAIEGMFDSDDYAALIPARDRGFSEMNIMLTQEM